MTTKTLDAISTTAVILGAAEGLGPFIAKATGWTPLWILPRHLDAPAWWIASLAVLLCAAIVLALSERAKQATAG